MNNIIWKGDYSNIPFIHIIALFNWFDLILENILSQIDNLKGEQQIESQRQSQAKYLLTNDR